jgi:hypothetical protein
MTEGSEEIIQGVGNEVFYFFLVLGCLLLVAGAWFSTHVPAPGPIISSVFLLREPDQGRSPG